MNEWADEILEVVTDWMRVHEIEADEDALEELRDDVKDTLEWKMLMKMSALTGGRV